MLEKCKLTGFSDEIHQDIQTQINVLEKLGQSYIELRSANGKGVADFTIEEAEQLKKLLDEKGMKVSAIGSPIGKILITEDFEPHLETYKHVVSLAKLFNTRYIRMFSFFIPKGEDPTKYHDEVMKRIEQLVHYAIKEEVILLHENEKDIYGDIASRCCELMENFYGDYFKCTFDFANFVQCNQDTMEAYQMLKPYIEYIHVKDALIQDGEVVPPGHGDGKLIDILQALHKENFKGFLSLEPHLSNFEGLKNLEREMVVKKISSGEAAYELAYHEFKKLLICELEK